jgi:hypothetical protein
MKCNCDCHKKNAQTELQKCRESNKKRQREINELRTRMLKLTILCAVIGTVVGKEALDVVLEWFSTFDKINSTVLETTNIFPSPSALAVFALPLFLPIRRRR